MYTFVVFSFFFLFSHSKHFLSFQFIFAVVCTLLPAMLYVYVPDVMSCNFIHWKIVFVAHRTLLCTTFFVRHDEGVHYPTQNTHTHRVLSMLKMAYKYSADFPSQSRTPSMHVCRPCSHTHHKHQHNARTMP